MVSVSVSIVAKMAQQQEEIIIGGVRIVCARRISKNSVSHCSANTILTLSGSLFHQSSEWDQRIDIPRMRYYSERIVCSVARTSTTLQLHSPELRVTLLGYVRLDLFAFIIASNRISFSLSKREIAAIAILWFSTRECRTGVRTIGLAPASQEFWQTDFHNRIDKEPRCRVCVKGCQNICTKNIKLKELTPSKQRGFPHNQCEVVHGILGHQQ